MKKSQFIHTEKGKPGTCVTDIKGKKEIPVSQLKGHEEKYLVKQKGDISRILKA